MCRPSFALTHSSSHDTATTAIYTLSLHDALPICHHGGRRLRRHRLLDRQLPGGRLPQDPERQGRGGAHGLLRRAHRRRDRKSTRLNSSHITISYAVFCLKKKKTP